jgi:hypothetical protein
MNKIKYLLIVYIHGANVARQFLEGVWGQNSAV